MRTGAEYLRPCGLSASFPRLRAKILSKTGHLETLLYSVKVDAKVCSSIFDDDANLLTQRQLEDVGRRSL